MNTKILLPTLLLGLAGGAFAQGDDCSNPLTVNLGSNPQDLTGFSDSFYYDGSCVGRDGFEDIWFVFTATTNDIHRFQTCGSDIDTTLRIFDGTACGGFCIAGNDDACAMSNGTAWASDVSTALVAGQSYLIQVETWDPGIVGIFDLQISSFPPPPNDTCSSADVLTGAGPWSFDTSGASASGFSSGSSITCGTGALDMGPDLFYEWTAPAAGDYQFDTCGSGYDTKLTVHAGSGCAAVCAGYNDDGPCGALNSEVVVTGVNAGDVFLLQVGGFGNASGSGVINIATWVDPCLSFGDDLYEENDTCSTGTALNDGLYGELTISLSDLDMYTFTVPDGGTLDVTCYHDLAQVDIDMFLYDVSFGACNDDPSADPINGGELASGWTSAAPEVLSWQNGTGADVDCVLRVSVWPSSTSPCGEYDLEISGTGQSGPALFCNPANANSTGNSVTLASSDMSGSGVFHIEAEGGPLDQFGMVIVSATSIDPGIPVSDGALCLGAPIGRYGTTAGPGLNSIGRFDAAGVLQNLFGTSTTGTGFDVPAVLPSPPGGIISTGSTWHFQLWYRDGSNSNFSNGISVNF